MAQLIDDVGVLLVNEDEAFILYADDGVTVLYDGTQHRLNDDEKTLKSEALAVLIALHRGDKDAQRKRSLRSNYDAWEDMFGDNDWRKSMGIPDETVYGDDE